MNLLFSPDIASAYRGTTQKIRRASEHWFELYGYCPCCGEERIARFSNNRPVADFVCRRCFEEFELKSQGRSFGPKVADGAYRTMIERLSSNTNPNLLLLEYDRNQMVVNNLFLVPKYYFVPQMIIKRPPLSGSARRAGWVGCNIALHGIPTSGRIFLVKDGLVVSKKDVVEACSRTSFLREATGSESRGWLLQVMACVESLKSATFSLADVYRFEGEFARQFPANRHVRQKIRQQLQVLRDYGFLEFLGKGNYRLVVERAGRPA